MAIGGPETPLALGTPELNIDEALATANAPGNAVIGTADASVPTRQAPRVPPVGMGNLQLGVEAPLYGWQPSQQDLGQGDVQHIRSGNFVTPVAERQLPFGAIDSRNQATALRRQKLEEDKAKAKAAFDPFKDVANPAAQHERAFSNYLKDDYQRFRKEQADARFGGDLAQADNWILSDPQGQQALKMRARAWDAAARESAGMTERAIDLLAKYQSGDVSIDPDDYNKLVRGLNGMDESGAPLQGVDIEEFRRDLRGIEGVLSKAQFTQQFLRGFDDFAQHAFSQGKAQRIGPNRWAIRAEDKLIFDDYKEAKAEEAVELGMFDRDINKARAHFDKLIKDRIDTKLTDWSPPTSGSSGSADKPKVAIGGVETGRSTTGIQEGGAPMSGVTPFPESGPTLGRANVQRRPVYQVIGGRNTPMGPHNFTDPQGEPVNMRPKYLEMGPDGLLYASGDLAGDSKTGTVTITTTEEDENGEMKEVTKTVDTSKGTTPFRVPERGNEAAFAAIFGPDYKQGFGGSGVPEVTSQEQYDKLPIGAKYMSGGQQYTKK